MTFIWFVLVLALLAAFAARWGADSRDDEYALGRVPTGRRSS